MSFIQIQLYSNCGLIYIFPYITPLFFVPRFRVFRNPHSHAVFLSEHARNLFRDFSKSEKILFIFSNFRTNFFIIFAD